MSAKEVDQYLRGLDEPKRSTLEGLRRTILEIVPEARSTTNANNRQATRYTNDHTHDLPTDEPPTLARSSRDQPPGCLTHFSNPTRWVPGMFGETTS
jgi:hypothetical protein